jgi:hypothetical protein
MSDMQPLGEHLTAAMGTITATGSNALSTTSSTAITRARLTDEELAALDAIVAAPLPPMAGTDERFLAQCLRMMSTLPRRKDDDVGGTLRVRAYQIAIGSYPKLAIEFMVVEALRTCQFFPSTSECLAILERWKRNDDAVRQRLRAKAAIMHERQARFDETMTAIADGMLDRDEINALPSSWLSVAETRSLIRMDDDGRWILRARFKPTPPSEAVVEGCCVDVDPEEGVEK